MIERNDPDPVGQLIREEGLLVPSAGFTDRVMQQIAAEKQVVHSTYAPLLSRRSWMLIFAAAALIVLACLAVLPDSPGKVNRTAGVLPAIKQFAQGIDLAISPIASGSMMLSALILSVIVLFLLVDYLLQSRFRHIPE